MRQKDIPVLLTDISFPAQKSMSQINVDITNIDR